MTTSPADRPVSAPAGFPTVHGRRRGYARDDVDAFLTRARAFFEGSPDVAPVTAAQIRAASFPLVRGGYQPASVDAALARIEDAFAAREREETVTSDGGAVWVDRTRGRAQEILDRLSRPTGQRFTRVSRLRYGYRVDEVDVVADRITRFLTHGDGVGVEQVRQVAFRMQRGGYSEAQVDAVLDAVIDVILAVG